MNITFTHIVGFVVIGFLFSGCGIGGGSVIGGDDSDVKYLEIEELQEVSRDEKKSESDFDEVNDKRDLDVEATTEGKVLVETDKGTIVFTVEVADDTDERMRGLMYREKLPALGGMLFIFDKEDEKSFWMKNTLIPLDMIFIDDDNNIVSIEKSAPPCEGDPCESFSSVLPARYVLEINGGLSEKMNIRKGNIVKFNL